MEAYWHGVPFEARGVRPPACARDDGAHRGRRAYRRGIARGWIAIGDVALGPLVAVGGLSIGVVSVGGFALGGLVLGGAAVGALAVGGLAIGIMAVGGAAFGLVGALGGLAVARDVAIGGGAFAQHANDAVARDTIGRRLFFRAADAVMDYSGLLVALPILMGLWRWRRVRRTPAGS